MVNGFVYSVTNSATGMFLRSGTARRNAPSIWNGPGIRPQNKPSATAPETDLRLRHHRFGCSSHGRKGAAQRFASTASASGRYLRKNFRGTVSGKEVPALILDDPGA